MPISALPKTRHTHGVRPPPMPVAQTLMRGQEASSLGAHCVPTLSQAIFPQRVSDAGWLLANQH